LKNISKWNSLENKQLAISLSVGIIPLLVFAICLPHSFSYSYAQLQGQFSPPASVKITSPLTGQKVAVGNLTISGTSSDTAASDCTVYADWDDVKPYQRVLSNGSSGGKDDYSKWYFTYTPAYHSIINGTNELTAKISCLDSPLNQTKWYSVNVTGVVPASTAAITNQEQANLTAATTTTTAPSGSGPTYFVFPQPATKIKVYEKNYHTENDGGGSSQPGPKALSILIHVAKDPIVRGNLQTITVTVSDDKSHGKIEGAHVEGTVHYTTTTTTTRPFSGVTDKGGQITPFSWTIGPNSNPGKFTVEVKVTANGYKTTSETSTFKVISGSEPPPPPTGLGKLSISINVAKDPIIRGNKQTISVTVSDDKSHGKIKGAHVEGTVDYVTDHTERFSGTTDKDGKISHSWTISGHANPGKFGIEIEVSAKGYQAASKTSSFTVKSKSSSSQPTNNIKSLNTQPEATGKDNPNNDTSGGTREETNTVPNGNNNNNGITSTDTKDKNKDADQNSQTDIDKASKIVTATGVDTKNDGHTKVDGKPEDQDKGNILDDHNDKKNKDDNSKATDDSDTHDKVKSKPESNNHDDNGGDKIKTTHEHKKSADKKQDKKPKEDSDKNKT
jgi:hypothetical protein